MLVVDATLENAVHALALHEPERLRDVLAAAAAPPLGGRGPAAVVDLPTNDAGGDAGGAVRLHLRPLRHGGWLGGLLGRRWLGLARPVAELEATAELRARGAPVPRPVGVVGHRVWRFWEAVVATVFEEDAPDAARFLARDPAPARIHRAARAAGHAVRRFHDAGGRHRDLHVGNLLVREVDERAEVIIVDLDRARLGPDPTAARRMAELMRLYRSLVKRGLATRVGPRGCAAFFAGYVGRDRDLRRALLARLGRERVRIRLHALGYR